MKIAFLVDRSNFNKYACVLPPDWEAIHFGNGPVDEDALVASKAEAILADPMLKISAAIIARMPQLKVIHSFGVGYNGIDCAAAKAAGIYVCNNAGVNAEAVAEQTVLLMLAVLRKYHYAEAMTYAARQGEFKGMCFENGLPELGDCKVGLIGFGAIGQEVARRLEGFGCEIYYHKRTPLDQPNIFGAIPMSQEKILSTCDIVSLHVPVTPATTNLICEETLKKMKPGAILINTSRGELVDQEALCRALTDGTLGGFGADVLAPEPVQPNNPVINLPEEIRAKVALSPHIGGITANTFRRSYVKAFWNISAVFKETRPSDIVNGL